MFVYKIKMNPDGTIEKFKVRLVALGNHQKYGETFSETYAPGTKHPPGPFGANRIWSATDER
jgi:hypothetical protein